MKIVLLWLVIIALPVQSFAAIGMATLNDCLTMTLSAQQKTNAAPPHHHAQSNDVSIATQCESIKSLSESHPQEKSHNCHSCCPGAAVFSSVVILSVPQLDSVGVAATADNDFAEYFPPALERPPSSLSTIS